LIILIVLLMFSAVPWGWGPAPNTIVVPR
jgi:hypothetical protein